VDKDTMNKATNKRQLVRFLAEGGDAWAYQGPLSDELIAALSAPAGNKIKYDATTKGFGIRVTASGGKAFVLSYRAGRRDRRLTIGTFGDWTTDQAREKAAEHKRRIKDGADPMLQREAARTALLVRELIDQFDTEHLPSLRPTTQHFYRRELRIAIRPTLGGLTVAGVTSADIQNMHRKIVARGVSASANNALSTVSALFAFAVKQGMRPDNPAKGVEWAPKHPKERFLTAAERVRLEKVLDSPRLHINTVSDTNTITCSNALRLFLLTGARLSETITATWSQIDLQGATWTKPHSSTKQKKIHRAPLSPQAVALLTKMRATTSGPFVFPARRIDGRPIAPLCVTTIEHFWRGVRKLAGIEDVRLHDLRHSFASGLASTGASLQVIGALIGHSHIQTTMRYAHLTDSALRAAVEKVRISEPPPLHKLRRGGTGAAS
jgi:integrase